MKFLPHNSSQPTTRPPPSLSSTTPPQPTTEFLLAYFSNLSVSSSSSQLKPKNRPSRPKHSSSALPAQSTSSRSDHPSKPCQLLEASSPAAKTPHPHPHLATKKLTFRTHKNPQNAYSAVSSMTKNERSKALSDRIEYPAGRGGRGANRGGGAGGRNRGGHHGNNNHNHNNHRNAVRDVADELREGAPQPKEPSILDRVTVPEPRNQEQRNLEALIEGQGMERKRRMSEQEGGWGRDREDKRHQIHSPTYTHRDLPHHRVRPPPSTYDSYDSYHPRHPPSPPRYYTRPLTPPRDRERDREREPHHNRSFSHHQQGQPHPGYKQPPRAERADRYRPSPPPHSPIDRERRRSISPPRPPPNARPQPQRSQSNQHPRKEAIELFPDRPLPPTPVTPTVPQAGFGRPNEKGKNAGGNKNPRPTLTVSTATNGTSGRPGTATSTSASTVPAATPKVSKGPAKNGPKNTNGTQQAVAKNPTTTTTSVTTASEAAQGSGNGQAAGQAATMTSTDLLGSGPADEATVVTTKPKPIVRLPQTALQSKVRALPPKPAAPASAPTPTATEILLRSVENTAKVNGLPPPEPAQQVNVQATEKAPTPQIPLQALQRLSTNQPAPASTAKPTIPQTSAPISPIIKLEPHIKSEIKSEATTPHLLSPTRATSTPSLPAPPPPTPMDPTRPVDRLFDFLSGETSKANNRSSAESSASSGTPPATILPPPPITAKPLPTPTQSRPPSPTRETPKPALKTPLEEPNPMDIIGSPLTARNAFPKLEDRYKTRIIGLQNENKILRDQLDAMRSEADQVGEESAHYHALCLQKDKELAEARAMLEKNTIVKQRDAEIKALYTKLEEEAALRRVAEEKIRALEAEVAMERERRAKWERDVDVLSEIVARNQFATQMDTGP
ncbi:hypothetical protein BJ508DRAFT_181525 [Ascobolus immersus RN42]|uniref:Uncharacterized protein n=1 Tax=Ascobolus immersus RN42 TaxID=1160509 RepID=A0A3N4HUG3_ASCIM|nr:hypothetical protein BJ508DRAFT_181525 [Ascobolus immersus RN42]